MKDIIEEVKLYGNMQTDEEAERWLDNNLPWWREKEHTAITEGDNSNDVA